MLRNGAEGPEAWIRAVGPNWKPGDDYMVRVVAVVDRTHPALAANGLQLRLTQGGDGRPGARRHHGRGGQVLPAAQGQDRSGLRDGDQGGRPRRGPLRRRRDVHRGPGGHHPDGRHRQLAPPGPHLPRAARVRRHHRAHRQPEAGRAPIFEWKAQGGDTPLGRTAFPALPKGCKPDYKVTEGQGTDKPAPKPSPSAATPSAATPSTATPSHRRQACRPRPTSSPSPT
ncbi:hypothetical protein ACFSNO_24415 [Streptomyces cirratus]